MKKIWIILAIVILLALAGTGAWFWREKGPIKVNWNGGEDNVGAPPVPVIPPENRVFESGNPFEADVNPHRGYTNPFSN